jgi:hypothetical protein
MFKSSRVQEVHELEATAGTVNFWNAIAGTVRKIKRFTSWSELLELVNDWNGC